MPTGTSFASTRWRSKLSCVWKLQVFTRSIYLPKPVPRTFLCHQTTRKHQIRQVVICPTCGGSHAPICSAPRGVIFRIAAANISVSSAGRPSLDASATMLTLLLLLKRRQANAKRAAMSLAERRRLSTRPWSRTRSCIMVALWTPPDVLSRSSRRASSSKRKRRFLPRKLSRRMASPGTTSLCKEGVKNIPNTERIPDARQSRPTFCPADPRRQSLAFSKHSNAGKIHVKRQASRVQIKSDMTLPRQRQGNKKQSSMSAAHANKLPLVY